MTALLSPDPTTEPLRGLIADAWRIYRTAEADHFRVAPAIPILFFGDLNAYCAAPRKVITAALNPSGNEFPAAQPFLRFPQAEDIYPAVLDGQMYDRYIAAQCAYFHHQPYRAWFNRSFEQVLRGLGCSYYAGTALHTDLASPLATQPKWSGLTKAEQARLEAEGFGLWRRLLDFLQPDVILLSVARAHLRKLTSTPLADWVTIWRADTYIVQTHPIALAGGKTAHVVYAPVKMRTPFGVAYQRQNEIGVAIKLYLEEKMVRSTKGAGGIERDAT